MTIPRSLLLVLVLTSALARAEPPACGAAKSHEFDFWIGDWEVTNRDGGRIVGRNRVKPILDGCALQETWTGVSGSGGTSLNYYDTQAKKWRQFWIWREGTALELAGEYARGSMVMSGDSTEADGSVVKNRITWFDNADRTVRQLWEVSKDGGKTWAVEFDGIYRRSQF